MNKDRSEENFLQPKGDPQIQRSKSCNLQRVENLFKDQKFDEALQYLRRFDQLTFSLTNQLQAQFIRGKIYLQLKKYGESLLLLEWVLQTAQTQEDYQLALEAGRQRIEVLWKLGKIEKAIEFLPQGDLLVQFLEQKCSIDPKTDMREIGRLKGDYFLAKGLLYSVTGRLNLSLEFYKLSLSLMEKYEGDKSSLAKILNNIGNIYKYKGELNKALTYFQRCLTIGREIKDLTLIGLGLANTGKIYNQKGELDIAWGNFLEGLELFKSADYKMGTLATLYYLVCLSVEKKDLVVTQQFMTEIKTIDKSISNKYSHLFFRLSQAVYLKAKGNLTGKLTLMSLKCVIDSLVMAKDLFIQISEEPLVDYEATVDALLNLCEIFILELKLLGNEDLITDINRLTQKLSQISHSQKAFGLMIETILLQSKMALLDREVDEAKTLLTQGHSLALEYGLDRLAKIIEKEQQILTGDLSTLLVDEKVSLFDRLGKLRLDGFIVALRQNRLEQFMSQQRPFQTPSMEKLQSFANELKKKKFEW